MPGFHFDVNVGSTSSPKTRPTGGRGGGSGGDEPRTSITSANTGKDTKAMIEVSKDQLDHWLADMESLRALIVTVQDNSTSQEERTMHNADMQRMIETCRIEMQRKIDEYIEEQRRKIGNLWW